MISREMKERVVKALWSIAEARAPGAHPVMSTQAAQALKDCQETLEQLLSGENPAEVGEPVAWMRKWNFRGAPFAEEFTRSIDLAEIWREHPQTDEVVPLYDASALFDSSDGAIPDLHERARKAIDSLTADNFHTEAKVIADLLARA